MLRSLLLPARLFGASLRPVHCSPLFRHKVQPTPDMYLKDDGSQAGQVSSGLTEDGDAHKYVVAGQLPSEGHYGVPAGAYHSSDPLEPLIETERPRTGQPSSTSPDYAHPVTTQAAASVEDGIGSSSAVRFRNAPGKMEKGGYGGARLSEGVTATENTLDERNPQPLADGGKGIDHAWKERK